MAQFEAPTERLEIVSELVLDRYPLPEPLPEANIPGLYPFSYTIDEQMDLGAMLQPENPEDESTLRDWLAAELGDLEQGQYDALSLLAGLNRAVNDAVTYEARQVEGTQTARATLQSGAGTCRDMAALMIDAARILGFGARFVTGYLYSPALDRGSGAWGGTASIGAAATHAWVEIYVPARGWISYDPTNNFIESADLIRVATVRSARQAVPVSGSYSGPTGTRLSVAVEITALPTPPDDGNARQMVDAGPSDAAPENMDARA
ncbi:MAG: transglutaminase family protein [Pseudomonadota bacterium]